MKIVHISTLYYPFVGGLEIAVQRVAEEQAKLGHEVYVISSDAYAENKLEEGIVTVVRVRSWKSRYPFLIVPRDIPMDILKGADAVLGWGHTYYFVYKTVRKAKIKFGKSIMQYFIGVDYLKHHYNPLIRIAGYSYQKLLTQSLAKIVDLPLVTNEYEKRLLWERYGLDAIVVPHGIDEKYLSLPNMAENFRKKYDVEGRIIAYIGRIHPTKGLDILVKAFIRAAKEEPNTVLVIAGKGDEGYLKRCLRIAKKAGVEDKIRVLGYVSEEDKIALIDASDVVVLPTRHAGESYPLLINEVLARGKRFVMTRGSIASKWVEESCVGRIADPNPLSLARALIDELRSEGAEKGGKTINILTWRGVAHELLDLL
jgi:glycosyltransferase involved in cell wall biosynthesis